MQTNQILKSAIIATLAVAPTATLAASTTPNTPPNQFRAFGAHSGMSTQHSVSASGSSLNYHQPAKTGPTKHGHVNTGGAVVHYQLPHGFRAIGKLMYLNTRKATGQGTSTGEYVELGASKLFTGMQGGRAWSIRPALLVGYSHFNPPGGNTNSFQPGGRLRATWGDFGLSFLKEPWENKDASNGAYFSSPYEIQGHIKLPLANHGLTSVSLHGGGIIPDYKLGNNLSVNNFGYIAGVNATYKPQLQSIQSMNFGAEYIGGLSAKNGYSGQKIPLDQEATMPYDPRHPAQSYREGIQAHVRTRFSSGLGISLNGGYKPQHTSDYSSNFLNRNVSDQFDSWDIGGSISYNF